MRTCNATPANGCGGREGDRADPALVERMVATILHRGPERTIPLLNGMFAFACLDLRCGALWLARDRLGIKPLYLAQTGEDRLCASEVKALLAHPGAVKRVDEAALGRAFLVRRRSHDTLFAGIEVPPPSRSRRTRIFPIRMSEFRA